MKAASLILLALSLRAETGRDAWLRYAPVPSLQAPAVVSAVGDSVLVASARQELIRGLRGMTGRISRAESGVPKESAIVLGTLASLPPRWALTASLKTDGYWLKTVNEGANSIHDRNGAQRSRRAVRRIRAVAQNGAGRIDRSAG